MATIKRSRGTADAPCLSAHEMAALVVLGHSPIEAAMETPDVVALEKAGLAELIESAIGEFRITITPDGNAVLRVLGALNDRR